MADNQRGRNNQQRSRGRFWFRGPSRPGPPAPGPPAPGRGRASSTSRAAEPPVTERGRGSPFARGRAAIPRFNATERVGQSFENPRFREPNCLLPPRRNHPSHEFEPFDHYRPRTNQQPRTRAPFPPRAPYNQGPNRPGDINMPTSSYMNNSPTGGHQAIPPYFPERAFQAFTQEENLTSHPAGLGQQHSYQSNPQTRPAFPDRSPTAWSSNYNMRDILQSLPSVRNPDYYSMGSFAAPWLMEHPPQRYRCCEPGPMSPAPFGSYPNDYYYYYPTNVLPTPDFVNNAGYTPGGLWYPWNPLNNPGWYDPQSVGHLYYQYTGTFPPSMPQASPYPFQQFVDYNEPPQISTNQSFTQNVPQQYHPYPHYEAAWQNPPVPGTRANEASAEDQNVGLIAAPAAEASSFLQLDDLPPVSLRFPGPATEQPSATSSPQLVEIPPGTEGVPPVVPAAPDSARQFTQTSNLIPRSVRLSSPSASLRGQTNPQASSSSSGTLPSAAWSRAQSSSGHPGSTQGAAARSSPVNDFLPQSARFLQSSRSQRLQSLNRDSAHLHANDFLPVSMGFPPPFSQDRRIFPHHGEPQAIFLRFPRLCPALNANPPSYLTVNDSPSGLPVVQATAVIGLATLSLMSFSHIFLYSNRVDNPDSPAPFSFIARTQTGTLVLFCNPSAYQRHRYVNHPQTFIYECNTCQFSGNRPCQQPIIILPALANNCAVCNVSLDDDSDSSDETTFNRTYSPDSELPARAPRSTATSSEEGTEFEEDYGFPDENFTLH